jgi:hypothetical protein
MMGTAGVDDPGNDRGGGGPRDDAGPSDSGILDGMIDPIPDAMADSGSTSGTRLKARYYAGADGSIQSGIGWYDSQRNENCFFQTASDGTLRCLPSGEASGAGVYFVDASCTTEELVTIGATGCVVTPKYASRYVTQTDPCSVSRLRVYSVGSEFTGNHYVKIGTMCTAATPNAGLRYFRLGAEVDPSSFVRATEEVEQ